MNQLNSLDPSIEEQEQNIIKSQATDKQGMEQKLSLQFNNALNMKLFANSSESQDKLDNFSSQSSEQQNSDEDIQKLDTMNQPPFFAKRNTAEGQVNNSVVTPGGAFSDSDSQSVSNDFQSVESANGEKVSSTGPTDAENLNNPSASGLSKSKKSMQYVATLSDKILEEILFSKINPCPIEQGFNNKQNMAQGGAFGKQFQKSQKGSAFQQSQRISHGQILNFNQKTPQGAQQFTQENSGLLADNINFQQQNQHLNYANGSQQNQASSNQSQASVASNSSDGKRHHCKQSCSYFHKSGKDRRRFLLSQECLKANNLTINSPPEQLINLLRKVLTSDDENSWQSFKYKSRRCTNREHKQLFQQIHATSRQSQFSGQPTFLKQSQQQKIFQEKLDECTFAHTQIEQDLHPQTFCISELPSMIQENQQKLGTVNNSNQSSVQHHQQFYNKGNQFQELKSSVQKNYPEAVSHAQNNILNSQHQDFKPQTTFGQNHQGDFNSKHVQNQMDLLMNTGTNQFIHKTHQPDQQQMIVAENNNDSITQNLYEQGISRGFGMRQGSLRLRNSALRQNQSNSHGSASFDLEQASDEALIPNAAAGQQNPGMQRELFKRPENNIKNKQRTHMVNEVGEQLDYQSNQGQQRHNTIQFYPGQGMPSSLDASPSMFSANANQPQGQHIAQLEPITDPSQMFEFFQGNPNIKHLNLKHFKVHPCTNVHPHNPKKCFFYHGLLDRRRITFYHEEMCERGQYCRNQICDKAHNNTEHLYHPDRYKFKFCSLPLSKCQYGEFCSFAHTEQDIKTPLIHKLLPDEQLQRGADGFRQMREFYAYYFKTEWCPFTHDHSEGQCVYAHNWQDFRRKPHLFNFNPFELCEKWQSDAFLSCYQAGCPLQSYCAKSHSWKEQIFHPFLYKTKPCPEIQPPQPQNQQQLQLARQFYQQLVTSRSHLHCGYHHGEGVDKLQPNFQIAEPMQPLHFELHCDPKLLCLSNPNHLKQFLLMHPAGLSGYDLPSLQILFQKHQISHDILTNIELRGVVPNPAMQMAKVAANQAPEILESINYVSPFKKNLRNNGSNSVRGKSQQPPVAMQPLLMQNNDVGNNINYQPQQFSDVRSVQSSQFEQAKLSNDSANQFSHSSQSDQPVFQFNQNYQNNSNNKQADMGFSSSNESIFQNQQFTQNLVQQDQQQQVMNQFQQNNYDDVDSPRNDQAMSADVIQSLEKWLDIDEGVPEVKVTWPVQNQQNQSKF